MGWSNLPPSRAVTPDPLRAQTVKALVTGFINAKPEHLHVLPATPDATGKPWPSRRTWTMLMDSMSHVREDDLAAMQALAFGLVGEGVGVEFLEWVANADLPDPAAVIADPSSVDWSDRPDRVWAVLSGVVGWAATQGTITAWRDAWGPLFAAASQGAFDVAASAARSLGRIRPTNAKPPADVKRVFAPILRDAGLAGEAA